MTNVMGEIAASQLPSELKEDEPLEITRAKDIIASQIARGGYYINSGTWKANRDLRRRCVGGKRCSYAFLQPEKISNGNYLVSVKVDFQHIGPLMYDPVSRKGYFASDTAKDYTKILKFRVTAIESME